MDVIQKLRNDLIAEGGIRDAAATIANGFFALAAFVFLMLLIVGLFSR